MHRTIPNNFYTCCLESSTIILQYFATPSKLEAAGRNSAEFDPMYKKALEIAKKVGYVSFSKIIFML